MDRVALEWIADSLLAALARGAAVDAPALTFLVRRYRATLRVDLREALEPALASAVADQALVDTTGERAAWLTLFAEALALSDDERVRDAVAALIAALRSDWGRAGLVDAAMASVDACLACGHLDEGRRLVPAAIDELERVVAAAYNPGAGLAHSVGEPSGVRGCLADHVRAASALLTAFATTGRLSYSMLAEELMQFARRALWDDETGGFSASNGDRQQPFVLNCEAARVLCRLAALHGEREYREAAVLASGADYENDAARILSAGSRTYQVRGLSSAAYGLALEEWLALP